MNNQNTKPNSLVEGISEKKPLTEKPNKLSSDSNISKNSHIDNYNIYRDIDEELDKLRKVIPGIYDGWDIVEVKNFIHKQIDKAVMETEVKTGLANFKVCREEIDKAIDKTNREWEKKNKEICICAAVLSEDGQIIRGHRHGDCFHTIIRMGLKVDKKMEAQGFITSKNRFVSREEGRKLQDAAGIKSADPEGYHGNTLFSEDLY